jgi:hypothetical protein
MPPPPSFIQFRLPQPPPPPVSVSAIRRARPRTIFSPATRQCFIPSSFSSPDFLPPLHHATASIQGSEITTPLPLSSETEVRPCTDTRRAPRRTAAICPPFHPTASKYVHTSGICSKSNSHSTQAPCRTSPTNGLNTSMRPPHRGSHPTF